MKNERYVGVMVKCKDKILLCKRNHDGSFPGMWSIPAGKLEKNETTQEGAKREFYEETDFDISNEDLQFIGVIPRHTRDGKKIKGIMYVYLLEVDDEIEPDLENAVDGDEHSEWGYFSFKEIRPEKCGTQLYKICELILVGKNK
jgi:8-oxo-dGTP pyrophosphatase MutT (NUDIX family)